MSHSSSNRSQTTPHNARASHRSPGSATKLLLAVAWTVGGLALVPFGRALVDYLRERNGLAITVGTVLAITVVVLGQAMVRALRRGDLPTRRFAMALVYCLAIASATWFLPRIEERWHVVQYGVAGMLWFLALRRLPWASQDTSRLRTLVSSSLLVAALGWLDEGIQWILPSRVYDLHDVRLNVVSGMLGSFGTALLLPTVTAGADETAETVEPADESPRSA